MLAESYEASPDQTVFTFKLRPGVKFHDGTALDATVVKNNLDAFRGTVPGPFAAAVLHHLQEHRRCRRPRIP